jgi:putative nucleotidyltransferase with HDIG domain
VQRNRHRLTLYVSLISVAGLVCLVAAVREARPVAAVVFMLTFMAAELARSNLRDDVMVSLSNLVVLVAILVDGTSLAVLATLGALPVFAVQAKDQRLLRAAFNTGQYALSAALAGGSYAAIVTFFGAQFPEPATIVAVTVAAGVWGLVNYLLVGVVVALASGEPMQSALSSIVQVGSLQVPYVGIAILAAALLQAGALGPALLSLLVLPAFVARMGLLAFQRTDEAYDRLVRSFVTAIEVKDLYTRGHSERVAELSVHVAEELGVPYDERRLTGYAALLHDVGKIGVPLCVINKPGPLDDAEFDQIKQHPTIGARILRDIDFLAPVLDVVRFHHERLDGCGYPHGVGEDELGDLVRIVTTADAFDAMTSTRSYRRALGIDEAVAELRRCAGRQFDPRMVEALATVVERLDWQPTVDFASAPAGDAGSSILGTATERTVVDPGGSS